MPCAAALRHAMRHAIISLLLMLSLASAFLCARRRYTLLRYFALLLDMSACRLIDAAASLPHRVCRRTFTARFLPRRYARRYAMRAILRVAMLPARYYCRRYAPLFSLLRHAYAAAVATCRHAACHAFCCVTADIAASIRRFNVICRPPLRSFQLRRCCRCRVV